MAGFNFGLQRQVSLRYSDMDGVGEGDELDSILEGNFDDLPPLGARIVRVFISSTFSGRFFQLSVCRSTGDLGCCMCAFERFGGHHKNVRMYEHHRKAVLCHQNVENCSI